MAHSYVYEGTASKLCAFFFSFCFFCCNKNKNIVRSYLWQRISRQVFKTTNETQFKKTMMQSQQSFSKISFDVIEILFTSNIVLKIKTISIQNDIVRMCHISTESISDISIVDKIFAELLIYYFVHFE